MKKRLISLLLVLAMLLGTLTLGVSALQLQTEESIEPGSWADGFADPDSAYDPGFRYWLPLGYTEDAELERELEAMAAQGLSVVEMTTQANPTGVIPEGQKYAGLNYASAEAYGMGSDEWTRTIYTTLKKANELGIRVDYHVSQNNGSNKHVPGLSPNDDAASKELVYQAAPVSEGVLPELSAVTPAAKTYRDNVTGESGLPLDQHLFAALLVNITEKGRKENRLAEGDIMGGSAGIQRMDVVVDVIDTDKTVDVTALYGGEGDAAAAQAAVDAADLENGTWEVIGFWWRGDCVTVSGSTEYPSYRIDYFNKAGANALMDYYEEHVFQLNNPEFEGMAELLKENGGYLFADSYGANANWGNDLPAKFEENTGESIVKYLPGIIQPVYIRFGGSPKTFGYVLDDMDTTNAFLADYRQAMTDLYCENDLDVLVERCADIGIGYRDQVVYATSRLDMIQAAAHVDVAEGESLNNCDSSQYFTGLSSAAHLLGKEIVSSEHGAMQGTYSGSYNYSLDTALVQANRAIAGGVNQFLFHGYTYNYMDFDAENAKWPGRTAYTNGFAENWKDNLPQWTQIDVFSNYASRVGYVMRTGTVKRDIALYKQSYWWPRHVGIAWVDHALQDAGYTFDMLSTSLLDYPEATVTDGVLAAETAGYKAFIFDATEEKHFKDVSPSLITLEAIEKFVEYAEAGLPIVFVKNYPTGLQGLHTADDQARFEAALATLKAMDNVALAEDQAAVPAVLEALGVEPAAKNLNPDRIISYHTETEDANFYWLCNQSKNYVTDWVEVSDYVEHFGGSKCDGYVIKTQMALEGEGVPFLMNPFSGEITPIADYTVDEDGRIVVDVELDIDGAVIIAVGSLAEGEAAVHGTVNSDNATLVYNNDNLMVQATAAGSYQAALNNGSVATVDVETVPDVTLSNWNLSIDSYTNKNPIDTVGKAATEMKHTYYNVGELDTLVGWMDLGVRAATITDEEDNVTTGEVNLKDLSGVGTYTATLTTPETWTANDGVYLNVGSCYSVFKVRVNGTDLPNQDTVNGKIDLRAYLHAGDNTVEIITASGLVNALRTLRPDYNNRKVHAAYGLLEDVTVTPYTLVNVPDSTAVVSLAGASDVTVDTEALTYTVSASQMENLATATIQLALSGNYVGEPVVEGMNGFYVIATDYADGRLTAVIGNNTGVSSEEATDILSVTLQPSGKTGTVAVTLTDAVLSAYCASAEMFLAVTLDNASVETDVHYSVYDVNQDGTVDQLDITRAQRAYGASEGDSNWNVLADVDGNGVVDIADLILILNNYSE